MCVYAPCLPKGNRFYFRGWGSFVLLFGQNFSDFYYTYQFLTTLCKPCVYGALFCMVLCVCKGNTNTYVTSVTFMLVGLYALIYKKKSLSPMRHILCVFIRLLV